MKIRNCKNQHGFYLQFKFYLIINFSLSGFKQFFYIPFIFIFILILLLLFLLLLLILILLLLILLPLLLLHPISIPRCSAPPQANDPTIPYMVTRGCSLLVKPPPQSTLHGSFHVFATTCYIL